MADVRGEVSCSAEDYEKCKDEFAAFRNANRAVARGPEYFRWRYCGRPNNALPIIVVARDASGAVAGALSVIPHHYHVGGSLKRLGVLGDISVSEKYRGRGVAKKMFACLSGLDEVKKLEGCVVLPNEEALRPLEKSGWVIVTALERHVKPLSTREMVARRLNRKAATLISPALDIFLRLVAREPSLRGRGGFAGGAASGFDSRFDELWAAVDKDGMILGLRNSEYLTWRFSGHPAEKYGVYTLSEGTRLRGYIVFHSVGAACHIDDFLCLRDGESWDHLLSFFIGHIRESAAASEIVININQNSLTGVRLRKFGFFKSPDILNLMVLQQGGAGTLGEGDGWFITAGDKDV